MPKACCSTNSKRRAQSACGCGTNAQNSSVSSPSQEETQPCCSSIEQSASPNPDGKTCGCAVGRAVEPWMDGVAETPAGPIPRASTKLSFADVWGSWKARWSIGRMDYKVEPGLYCVGNPDARSPVLVTANYKMTFDRLRKELPGVDAWVLVLDTKGINVWCAAGKGTFGTDELVNRIAVTGLENVVSHRTVVLPQLGAVGVAAHEAAKRSGFHVVYGPVRAEDLKAFLSNGMQATEEMRKVKFTLWDRLVLAPMETVGAIKPSLIVFGILFILNALGFGHYHAVDLYAYLGTIFAGTVLVPVLLPWIPGRAFSFKGFLLGLLWAVGVCLMNGFPAAPAFSWWKAAAYLLLLPALSAFIAMNFTGSSTFTSMSGVDKEMKIALPLMIIASAAGMILLLINDFILLFR